jgi:hypothetical protein
MPKSRKNVASNYELHKAMVYEDPDFVAVMDELAETISNRVSSYDDISVNQSQIIETNGNKKTLIGFDVNFKSKTYPLPEEYIDIIFNIAKEYFIEPEDIAHYLSMKRILPPEITPSVSKDKRVSVHMDTDGVYIRLDSPFASQRDVLEAWDNVEQMKNIAYENYEQSKLKSNENPRLIYALFKARKSGLSFRQIAELLNENRLPFMSNSSKADIYSEEQLTKLYSRYRPDR